jgi:phosphoglycerate dehydrogenase-like enzyme/phosphoserine aminotransferase
MIPFLPLKMVGDLMPELSNEALLQEYKNLKSYLENTPVPAKPSNSHFGVGPIMKLKAEDSVQFAQRTFEFNQWVKKEYGVEVHDLEQHMHRYPKSVEITKGFLKEVHRYFEYGDNNTLGIGLGGGHSAFTVLTSAMLHPRLDVFVDTPKPGTPEAGVGAFRNSWATQITDRYNKAQGGPYPDKIHYSEKEGIIPSADELEKKNIKVFVGVGNETTGATTYNQQDIKNLLDWINRDRENHQVILDATSLMGAVNLPKEMYREVMEKCCVFTPAQKAIGGEAGLALFSLTPQAQGLIDRNVKDLKWPAPREYQIATLNPSDTTERSVEFGPFYAHASDKMLGGVINTTPTRDIAYSQFALLKTKELIGDVHQQNARSLANLKTAEEWFKNNDMFSIGVADETRRSASVLLFKVNENDIDANTKAKIVARSKEWLDKEGRADNINTFPGTPGDYRGWIGGVRESSDIVALLENVKYAYLKAKKEILEEKLIAEKVIEPIAKPVVVANKNNATLDKPVRVLIAEQLSLDALRDRAESETSAGRPTFVYTDTVDLGKEAKNGVHYYYQPDLTPDQIKDICADGKFKGLIIKPKNVPEDINIKLVVRIGSGTDPNLTAVKKNRKDIIVMNTPAQNAEVTAEYTIKALLDQLAPTRFQDATKAVLEGTLTSKDLSSHYSTELKGKIIIVGGMGYIGEEVAMRLKAFKANVIGVGYTRGNGTQSFTKEDANILGVGHANSLIEAINNNKVDALTVHPAGGANDYVSKEFFDNLKYPISVVNACRPGVVNFEGLKGAIENGKVKNLTIDGDSFPGEGRDQLTPYVDLAKNSNSNCKFIITPHFGGDVTQETKHNATLFAVEQMNLAIIDKKLRNVVSGDIPEDYQNIGSLRPSGVGRVGKAEIQSLVAEHGANISQAANMIAAIFNADQKTQEKYFKDIPALFAVLTTHPLAGRPYDGKGK